MTEQELKEVAKAAFPDYIQKHIVVDELGFFSLSKTYRLFDKSYGMKGILPAKTILSITLYPSELTQIESYGRTFCHAKAIDKLRELNLIE